MRTLALLLLLLNMVFGFWQLGLFAWLPWQPESFRLQRPQPTSASNLPRLILLGEPNLPNNTSITTEENMATTDQQETTPAATDSLADSSLTANNTTVTENHEIPDQSAEVTSTLQQAAGIAFDSDTDKTSITTAPSVPTMPSLVAEAPKEKPKELAEQSVACWKAGPYSSANQAKTMAEWLSEQKNVSVGLQPIETPVLKYTWVYLPVENQQAADNTIKEFREMGIREGYNIVTSGDKKAISLGVYSNPLYAELRVTELDDKGYKNIKTQKRYKNNTEYWLNVKIIAGKNEVLNTFRKKFSDSTLTTVACE